MNWRPLRGLDRAWARANIPTQPTPGWVGHPGGVGRWRRDRHQKTVGRGHQEGAYPPAAEADRLGPPLLSSNMLLIICSKVRDVFPEERAT